mgnify:CR=1 FL=1
MHFDSDINRPPYEAYDAYLQVTKGCSHGSKGGCDFCTFYKNVGFSPSPMEEVEADVQELRLIAARIPFDRIFLQGADSLILPYRRLVDIAELIHRELPKVTSIGGYARIDNLRNKSVDQLRHLAELGYSNFYFGNESGDDAVLARMHKGYEAVEIVRQLSKLDEAGMPYIMNFLGGLGGHGYGLGHARKTAAIINRLHPTMVYASELTLFPDTPLSRDVEEGRFEEATEAERYEELRELVACLEVPTIFKAEHVTLPEPIRGRLPEDRERLLSQLDRLVDDARAGKLDGFRASVMGL